MIPTQWKKETTWGPTVSKVLNKWVQTYSKNDAKRTGDWHGFCQGAVLGRPGIKAWSKYSLQSKCTFENSSQCEPRAGKG